VLLASVCEDSGMSDVEGHQHRYRSPVAAIVGLAESALQREDLDEDLLKQLQAIRLLAQEALAAVEDEEI
jgi:signal transduction histidine kinase